MNKLVLEYDTIKDIETETIMFDAVFILESKLLSYCIATHFAELKFA
jgi:hypothetical protein